MLTKVKSNITNNIPPLNFKIATEYVYKKKLMDAIANNTTLRKGIQKNPASLHLQGLHFIAGD